MTGDGDRAAERPAAPPFPPGSPRRRPVLPPTYFLGALVVSFVLNAFLPVRRTAVPALQLTGAVLIAAGIAITVLADRQFKQFQTTVHPFRSASTLVTGGVFRVSRNPMYLGMVAVLLGFALALGGVTPLIVPPLFGALLSARFIRVEERVLHERFGDAYVAYCRTVRRWL